MVGMRILSVCPPGMIMVGSMMPSVTMIGGGSCVVVVVRSRRVGGVTVVGVVGLGLGMVGLLLCGRMMMGMVGGVRVVGVVIGMLMGVGGGVRMLGGISGGSPRMGQQCRMRRLRRLLLRRRVTQPSLMVMGRRRQRIIVRWLRLGMMRKVRFRRRGEIGRRGRAGDIFVVTITHLHPRSLSLSSSSPQ